MSGRRAPPLPGHWLQAYARAWEEATLNPTRENNGFKTLNNGICVYIYPGKCNISDHYDTLLFCTNISLSLLTTWALYTFVNWTWFGCALGPLFFVFTHNLSRTEIADLQANNATFEHCELVELLFLATFPPKIGMSGFVVKSHVIWFGHFQPMKHNAHFNTCTCWLLTYQGCLHPKIWLSDWFLTAFFYTN